MGPFNLSLANEYIADDTIPTHAIKYKHFIYPGGLFNQIPVFTSNYKLNYLAFNKNFTPL